MINLILFGPPGSGKGTQSERIISAFDLVHFSTGDILRSEIAKGSELGAEAKKLMDAGQLVSDEIVIGMIASKILANKTAKGFIFDGFPRTTAQAEALDEMMKNNGMGVSLMLSLEVPEEELKKRLLKRGEIQGRTDDNEETIANRIVEYKKKTAPVAAHYKAQDKLAVIDGNRAIDVISKEISERLNAL